MPLSTDLNWPDGYDLIRLETVDSTNAEAARRAPEIARPTWIMADIQTQGRGRAGRSWSAPEGNLTATLVFRPEADPARAALRSFVAANALFDALAELAGPRDLSLKWPNDVVYRGGKIAGILLESSGTGGTVDWLAVGVGVNIAGAPPEGPDDTLVPIALDRAFAVSARAFLTLLATHFAREEARFVDQGFDPVRTTWLARAGRVGLPITARTRHDTFHGTFDTVDQTGNLILLTPAGRRAIAAADVYFD